jgi:hypothetical protein
VGYERFRAEKKSRELAGIKREHGLATGALGAFVDDVLRRGVFEGEGLSDLLAPLGLGWKTRRQMELAVVEDLAYSPSSGTGFPHARGRRESVISPQQTSAAIRLPGGGFDQNGSARNNAHAE